MRNPNELRETAMKGRMDEVFKFLERRWPAEKGERVLSEIGNPDQEWSYLETRGNKEITVKKKGWVDILHATAMGAYERDDITAKVVMTDGGRDPVGEMEGVKFLVSVYSDGQHIETVEISDDLKIDHVLNKHVKTVLKPAHEKLLDYLDGVKVEVKEVVRLSKESSVGQAN